MNFNFSGGWCGRRGGGFPSDFYTSSGNRGSPGHRFSFFGGPPMFEDSPRSRSHSDYFEQATHTYRPRRRGFSAPFDFPPRRHSYEGPSFPSFFPYGGGPFFDPPPPDIPYPFSRYSVLRDPGEFFGRPEMVTTYFEIPPRRGGRWHSGRYRDHDDYYSSYGGSYSDSYGPPRRGRGLSPGFVFAEDGASLRSAGRSSGSGYAPYMSGGLAPEDDREHRRRRRHRRHTRH